MRPVTEWVVSYLMRWLPHSSPTGLFAIGKPDDNSPIIVTANFSLTVRRVKKALKDQNVWLLVTNTNGINVWCAAEGGIFTEGRVIDAIKISGLEGRVKHRQVILPPLSASGIDCDAITKETGFKPEFGPVYARDIPEYLKNGHEKIENMQRFRFDWRHRLDMFIPMNFPIYLLIAVLLAVFGSRYVPGYTAIFWGAVAFLYLFIDVIPGKTGWGQAFYSAVLVIIVWAVIDWLTAGNPLEHWGWFIAMFAVFFAAGFDLAGTITARRSDAEAMMHRLGFRSLGTLFSEKDMGHITVNRNRCQGCGTCRMVCPVGVYGDLDEEKKTTMPRRDACFACGACVKQCPEKALYLA